MDYSYCENDGLINETKLNLTIRRFPNVLPTYLLKKPIAFSEMEYIGGNLEKFIKAELMIEAIKIEGILSPQVYEEINEKVKSKVRVQYFTVYEHPWMYKWGGFLHEA